jgi:indole-3-acetate monooxygenase
MPERETATALLEVARSFRPRLLAERDRIEAARRLPEDLARELAHAGFFRIFLPAAYGGLDLTPVDAMEVFEELARADASVAWCVWNGNTHWTAAQLSHEAARTIHGDPDVITANSTRTSGQAQVNRERIALRGADGSSRRRRARSRAYSAPRRSPPCGRPGAARPVS